MEEGEHGARATAAESASGERRPSISTLQNMLKKVSQSPFHNQYKDGEFLSNLSAAATDKIDNYQPHLGQNGLKTEDNHLHSTAQNGVNGSSARVSPFYAHYLKSTSKDYIMEAVGVESSEGANLCTILAPPPEFQSTSLDVQPEMKTLENGHKFSEPQKDLFQSLTHNHVQDLFHTSTLTPNTSANGHFHDETLNPPDLFKKNLPQTQNLSNFSLHSKNSDLFEGKGDDFLQAAQGEGFTHTAHAKEVNLFDKTPSSLENPFIAPSNKVEDLFQPSQLTALNPFYASSTNETDLFQAVSTNTEELFHVKKNEQDPTTKENGRSRLSFQESQDLLSSPFKVDPFASPISRDLFQDVSNLEDPFAPSKQYDPFQDRSSGTIDIFQPFALKTNNEDIFEITPNTASAYSTPSLNSTPKLKLDMLSSPDLSEAKPLKSSPAVKPKPSYRPQDIVLTTPQGTKRDILQPTPFSEANNLSVSPSQSPAEMTHVPTFKRPPKPLPRTRPPRTEKPTKPEKPPTPAKPIEPESTVPKVPPKPAFRSLPKPVIRHKPKTPESKLVDAENYMFFEDILLTGQERCVEDWPEDSPQLNPDFKPSGKYRLRRESLRMKTDSGGGSSDDQDPSESQSKKKDKKFRMSLVSRRGSKDKFPDETKEGRSRTLPRKSSQEYFSELHMGAGEIKDAEQNGIEYKQKKPLKTKVSQVLRRASTSSFIPERKYMKEHLPEESKDDEDNKKSSRKKNSLIRRWSEETMLNGGSDKGEEKDEGEAHHGESLQRRKTKVKIQFVPHRGFAITRKKCDDELRGAHGYTPHKGSQDDAFEDAEEIKDLQSSSKAAFMDDKHLQKPDHYFPGLNVEEDAYGIEDCKPKKPMKKKILHVGQRSCKEDMLEYTKPQKKKSSLSAEELDDEELNGMDDSMQDSKHKGPNPVQCKSKTTYDTTGQSEWIGFSHDVPRQTSIDAFAEDEDFISPGDMYNDEQDELETCKPKKTSKLKGFKKYKFKSKVEPTECEDLPGATCSDFMSEAAKAEWLAAQQDERAMAGLEEEDEEGDTDSLMEWWNTVEQWDEVPSDDESKVIQEDESKSFTILADKVHRGLRVFNKVFTERAEVLWQYIITLHAIADDISDFHQKAKIAGITGGTTTAVGGVAAITGLALAPFTFGASLLVTAVGVGVATAGGITSASAAISDNVNNMHDQKKVETVLKEYEAHLMDIGKILHFINQGLYKLRGHPFLRSGTQHYSEDWEIRRAVQTISLVDSPVMRATEVTDEALASVQGLFKGMDRYFIKDSRELKKSCKKEMVGKIKELANRLNEAIVELNTIREELQDSTGNI